MQESSKFSSGIIDKKIEQHQSVASDSNQNFMKMYQLLCGGCKQKIDDYQSGGVSPPKSSS